MDKTLLTVPNMFSFFRMAAVPGLLLLAWLGYEKSFLVLLVASFLSDFLDGWIARRFHLESQFGATLDSSADNITALSLPFCAWFLWPEILARELAYIITIFFIYIVTIIVALSKFKSLPAYHTWSAKVAAVVMSVSVCLLFLFNESRPFHYATAFMFWVGTESVLISLILPGKAHNVAHIGRALQLRQLWQSEQAPEREESNLANRDKAKTRKPNSQKVKKKK